MTPALFLRDIVDPSLKKLADWADIPVDDRARVLLMAIAGQESAWLYREQVGGPARSYWQFELSGGVFGLFNAVRPKLEAVCAELDVPFTPGEVFEAMAWHDTLACCMARLLLWTDPLPLPEVGAQEAAWECYERVWRPGAPRPATWSARYGTALALVRT